jgi:hypothetical protein
VPARLAVTTVKAAALVAAGKTAGVATPAAVLMNEVLRAMLMTKLKVYVAVGVVAVLLGVGGVAFRAAGQDRVAGEPARAENRAEARPLTELELLRREVDILKLQVEVMQNDLRALKEKAGSGPVAPPPVRPGVSLPPKPVGPLQPGANSTTTTARDAGPVNTAAARQTRPAGPGLNPEPDPEAALRALRESPEDDAVRRRAVEALEKLVQRLKEQSKPEGQPEKPQAR